MTSEEKIAEAKKYLSSVGFVLLYENGSELEFIRQGRNWGFESNITLYVDKAEKEDEYATLEFEVHNLSYVSSPDMMADLSKEYADLKNVAQTLIGVIHINFFFAGYDDFMRPDSQAEHDRLMKECAEQPEVAKA
jgi:hypothetical protein